ncbi:hypothetical protein HDU96_000210 [Phlyctochytrium bullatum]|nr:hypothetical protein HDU96_000210 [Phlyctochytrium bullatum]
MHPLEKQEQSTDDVSEPVSEPTTFLPSPPTSPFTSPPEHKELELPTSVPETAAAAFYDAGLESRAFTDLHDLPAGENMPESMNGDYHGIILVPEPETKADDLNTFETDAIRNIVITGTEENTQSITASFEYEKGGSVLSFSEAEQLVAEVQVDPDNAVEPSRSSETNSENAESVPELKVDAPDSDHAMQFTLGQTTDSIVELQESDVSDIPLENTEDTLGKSLLLVSDASTPESSPKRIQRRVSWAPLPPPFERSPDSSLRRVTRRAPSLRRRSSIGSTTTIPDTVDGLLGTPNTKEEPSSPSYVSFEPFEKTSLPFTVENVFGPNSQNAFEPYPIVSNPLEPTVYSAPSSEVVNPSEDETIYVRMATPPSSPFNIGFGDNGVEISKEANGGDASRGLGSAVSIHPPGFPPFGKDALTELLAAAAVATWTSSLAAGAGWPTGMTTFAEKFKDETLSSAPTKVGAVTESKLKAETQPVSATEPTILNSNPANLHEGSTTLFEDSKEDGFLRPSAPSSLSSSLGSTETSDPTASTFSTSSASSSSASSPSTSPLPKPLDEAELDSTRPGGLSYIDSEDDEDSTLGFSMLSTDTEKGVELIASTEFTEVNGQRGTEAEETVLTEAAVFEAQAESVLNNDPPTLMQLPTLEPSIPLPPNPFNVTASPTTNPPRSRPSRLRQASQLTISIPNSLPSAMLAPNPFLPIAAADASAGARSAAWKGKGKADGGWAGAQGSEADDLPPPPLTLASDLGTTNVAPAAEDAVGLVWGRGAFETTVELARQHASQAAAHDGMTEREKILRIGVFRGIPLPHYRLASQSIAQKSRKTATSHSNLVGLTPFSSLPTGTKKAVGDARKTEGLTPFSFEQKDAGDSHASLTLASATERLKVGGQQGLAQAVEEALRRRFPCCAKAKQGLPCSCGCHTADKDSIGRAVSADMKKCSTCAKPLHGAKGKSCMCHLLCPASPLSKSLESMEVGSGGHAEDGEDSESCDPEACPEMNLPLPFIGSSESMPVAPRTSRFWVRSIPSDTSTASAYGNPVGFSASGMDDDLPSYEESQLANGVKTSAEFQMEEVADDIAFESEVEEDVGSEEPEEGEADLTESTTKSIASTFWILSGLSKWLSSGPTAPASQQTASKDSFEATTLSSDLPSEIVIDEPIVDESARPFRPAVPEVLGTLSADPLLRQTKPWVAAAWGVSTTAAKAAQVDNEAVPTSDAFAELDVD